VKIFSHIPEPDSDIDVIKLNIQEDYVYMVVVIPTRTAVADVVRFIKTQSVKKIKEKFPFI